MSDTAGVFAHSSPVRAQLRRGAGAHLDPVRAAGHVEGGLHKVQLHHPGRRVTGRGGGAHHRAAATESRATQVQVSVSHTAERRSAGGLLCEGVHVPENSHSARRSHGLKRTGCVVLEAAAARAACGCGSSSLRGMRADSRRGQLTAPWAATGNLDSVESDAANKPTTFTLPTRTAAGLRRGAG